MKIGINVHGVLDKRFERYQELINELRFFTELHIITGIDEVDGLRENPELEQLHYDKWFSIHEECRNLGVDIEYDELGRPWVDPEVWDVLKALYCEREGIDFMIEDSPRYGKYFAGKTIYLQQHNNERDNWRHKEANV